MDRAREEQNYCVKLRPCWALLSLTNAQEVREEAAQCSPKSPTSGQKSLQGT